MLALHVDRTELNVEYLARWFGISRQSLQRLVKVNGTTLMKEITDLKKSRACNELRTSNKSVTELAHALGFGSSVSFARAFKTWTKLSPGHYRKHYRKANAQFKIQN